MTESHTAYLYLIQIRYRVRYITWLRLRAWAQANASNMSEACDLLLGHALDHQNVASDPNELIRLRAVSHA